jgi:glycosyltransferase 2 family protein
MQKRLIPLIKYAFFLGLAIFLVWWSVHKMDDKNYNEFINSLKTANYFFF